MSNERPSPHPSLADLEARLQKARQRETGPGRGRSEGEQTAIGMAFRLSVELVSSVVVGGLVGWALDRWLGTSPWFLLGFFLLGVIAGMVNVFRAARQLGERAAALSKGVPPAPADEDDD